MGEQHCSRSEVFNSVLAVRCQKLVPSKYFLSSKPPALFLFVVLAEVLSKKLKFGLNDLVQCKVLKTVTWGYSG